MAIEGGNSLRTQILSELEGIQTVDCHSHTQLRRQYYAAGGFDLFTMNSYFERDIATTAGGPIYDGVTTDEERWERLKGVLTKSRNVSYWRHNLTVYRDLFGLKDPELTDDNWRSVTEAIRTRSQDPSWYDHVTRDCCKLETQVRNIPWFEDWEPEYFTAILRMEQALELHGEGTRKNLATYLDASIDSLSTAKKALADLTGRYVHQGAIGIKLAHAYGRTLHSLPVTEERAAWIFDRALRKQELTPSEVKELQDHVIFYLADLANEMNLIFQIHTGVQGNWGHIPDSDPLLLIPLLRAFPKVRFDLFHAGYPYSRMLGMLGKHYPNVWLNMAWMYVISIAASRQILSEWIDLVPGYRILGFGSDVGFPEMIYGHLKMARSCVADVLATKAEKDFLSEEEALCLARKLFLDNGVEFYRLKSK